MKAVQLATAIEGRRLEAEEARAETGFVHQFGETDQPGQKKRPAPSQRKGCVCGADDDGQQARNGRHFDDAIFLEEQGPGMWSEDRNGGGGERAEPYCRKRAGQPADRVRLSRVDAAKLNEGRSPSQDIGTLSLANHRGHGRSPL
ncbi:hypothetical protein GCM10007937_14560 [Mesorhizobium albiziae]|nr:hypothetical protein GCM10007937_14560 [Mesorhizobium albiziae]